MQQKIAVHTFHGWIPDKERGELMDYCVESDKTYGTQLVADMEAAEKVLVDERAERDAKVAADEAKENFTVVHQSVAGEAYVFPHDTAKVALAKDEGPVHSLPSWTSPSLPTTQAKASRRSPTLPASTHV